MKKISYSKTLVQEEVENVEFIIVRNSKLLKRQ